MLMHRMNEAWFISQNPEASYYYGDGAIKMIEHEQLLKFSEDKNDYPVILYWAKIGTLIDWKENSPEEVLYIPEKIFQSIGRAFIKKIGSVGYYDKTILNEELVALLCGQRESSEYSEKYILTFTEIRRFVKLDFSKNPIYYLAFEGP